MIAEETTTSEVMLTKREIEVLTHIIQGYSAKEVADLLEISKRTVDFHLANVYKKLRVNNRMMAFRRAVALGMLSADQINPAS